MLGIGIVGSFEDCNSSLRKEEGNMNEKVRSELLLR